jgi:ribosomal protein L11 methylase PrmA
VTASHNQITCQIRQKRWKCVSDNMGHTFKEFNKRLLDSFIFHTAKAEVIDTDWQNRKQPQQHKSKRYVPFRISSLWVQEQWAEGPGAKPSVPSAQACISKATISQAFSGFLTQRRRRRTIEL